MKRDTKPCQKIMRQMQGFIDAMEKAQRHEPKRIIISNEAAVTLELKDGETFSGIPVVRESRA